MCSLNIFLLNVFSLVLANAAEFNYLVTPIWLTIIKLCRKVNYGYFKRSQKAKKDRQLLFQLKKQNNEQTPVEIPLCIILFGVSVFNELSGYHI